MTDEPIGGVAARQLLAELRGRARAGRGGRSSGAERIVFPGRLSPTIIPALATDVFSAVMVIAIDTVAPKSLAKDSTFSKKGTSESLA
jgi:hypothetical protein